MKQIKEIERIMKKYEKIIMFYNRKYNYDITLGTKKEEKQYLSALNIWDQLKSKRDSLVELYK